MEEKTKLISTLLEKSPSNYDLGCGAVSQYKACIALWVIF